MKRTQEILIRVSTDSPDEVGFEIMIRPGLTSVKDSMGFVEEVLIAVLIDMGSKAVTKEATEAHHHEFQTVEPTEAADENVRPHVEYLKPRDELLKRAEARGHLAEAEEYFKGRDARDNG